MLNCKRASLLASRAMDEKLPIWQNISLRMHLLLCHSCTAFSKQLAFLREASRRSRANYYFQLTNEAKKRIKNALQDKQTGN